MGRPGSAGQADEQLRQARRADASNQVLQAELHFLAVLRLMPDHVESLVRLSQYAVRRGQAMRAVEFLITAVRARPADESLVVDLAVALMAGGRTQDAMVAIEAHLRPNAGSHTAWLLLGQLRESAGDGAGALKAWYQAVTRAQRSGCWLDSNTTPELLLDVVLQAVERVRVGRRELFFEAFGDLVELHGAVELRRVERALTGYLRDWDSTPADSRQRPKFFYFPDLPNAPYQDPSLQPWVGSLQAAFEDIRAEALRVVAEDQRLPAFAEVPAGVRPGHLAGKAAEPSWEAFFFYRHGKRFDANHLRCPGTSAVLESIELCRIDGDAPEICFSVLRPGTHILPHHGVTNVRLVMHLPLLVPQHCALNLVGIGEHVWQEGRLVMFDDTYQHEAWNHSDSTRIVLLMDCWNPHLSGVERRAVKQLIEAISGLQNISR